MPHGKHAVCLQHVIWHEKTTRYRATLIGFCQVYLNDKKTPPTHFVCVCVCVCQCVLLIALSCWESGPAVSIYMSVHRCGCVGSCRFNGLLPPPPPLFQPPLVGALINQYVAKYLSWHQIYVNRPPQFLCLLSTFVLDKNCAKKNKVS